MLLDPRAPRRFFKHAGLQIDDEEQVEEVMKAGPKGLAVLRALVYEARASCKKFLESRFTELNEIAFYHSMGGTSM